jgi:hypothetical protein
MYGEIASVKETVDLSEQEALDSAQTFLTQQGYRVVERTDTSLTVERRPLDSDNERDSLNLTVVALPQQEGGVRVIVSGNDHEGVREHQQRWVKWSEGLPKRVTSGAENQHQQSESVPAPSRRTEGVIPPNEAEKGIGRSGAAPMIKEVIFDKADQLEKIKAGLLPGEDLEAVFDVKGGGTGFVGITSKRVIFQDNAWVMNTKAVVSIPYSRIHTVAAEDQTGVFGGRGFFSSSRIVITTSAGPKTFQFRGADKAHIAHDLILAHML